MLLPLLLPLPQAEQTAALSPGDVAEQRAGSFQRRRRPGRLVAGAREGCYRGYQRVGDTQAQRLANHVRALVPEWHVRLAEGGADTRSRSDWLKRPHLTLESLMAQLAGSEAQRTNGFLVVTLALASPFEHLARGVRQTVLCCGCSGIQTHTHTHTRRSGSQTEAENTIPTRAFDLSFADTDKY